MLVTSVSTGIASTGGLRIAIGRGSDPIVRQKARELKGRKPALKDGLRATHGKCPAEREPIRDSTPVGGDDDVQISLDAGRHGSASGIENFHGAGAIGVHRVGSILVQIKRSLPPFRQPADNPEVGPRKIACAVERQPGRPPGPSACAAPLSKVADRMPNCLIFMIISLSPNQTRNMTARRSPLPGGMRRPIQTNEIKKSVQ
jgi:hypothetical protein